MKTLLPMRSLDATGKAGNHWIRWTLVLAAFWIGALSATRADDAADAAALSAQFSEFYRAGKYAEAAPFAERLVKLSERLNGLEHPNTAASLN
jgi:hypothetical protein